MAQTTEQLTLLDFFDWCIRNIDSDKLAALMTSYGYSHSDSEAIAEAIGDPDFYNDFGALLRESMAEDKSYDEQIRADGEISAAEWIEIARSTTLAKATGSTEPSTMEIIGGLFSGFGGAITGLFGAKTPVVPAAAKPTGSSTFLWIILAVVILAVTVILVISTTRKK